MCQMLGCAALVEDARHRSDTDVYYISRYSIGQILQSAQLCSIEVYLMTPSKMYDGLSDVSSGEQHIDPYSRYKYTHQICRCASCNKISMVILYIKGHNEVPCTRLTIK